MIEAMEHIHNTAAVLVMLGNGSESERLQDLVARKALQQRVRFHPAVPPQELPFWTRDATVGVFALEGTLQSYRLALPNKLFEFIHAGLPVIVTDLPEMARIIHSYGVGEVFPDGRVDILAEKLDALLSDAARLEKYRAAALAAAKELNWERERGILADLYRSLQDRAGVP